MALAPGKVPRAMEQGIRQDGRGIPSLDDLEGPFWASQTSGADLEMGRHASKEKAPSLTEEEPAEAKGSETARGGG